MTPSEFKRSLTKTRPPSGLSAALTGLWWAGKDDWNKAHKIVMDDEGVDCAWVHAYLHRVEGDLDNARYWYGQARRPPAVGELEDEWAAIAATLLRMALDNAIGLSRVGSRVTQADGGDSLAARARESLWILTLQETD